MAKYRSVVPLASAPDVERPSIRLRYERLDNTTRRLIDDLGIWPDASIAEARRCIEARLQTLNVQQRSQLLQRIRKLIE